VKKHIVFIAALGAALLAGCAGSGSPVGLVDVQRLTANWPVYTNAQNQLVADQRAIAASKGSNADKQRQVLQLQQRYSQLSNQLVSQVRDAAAKVAGQKQLKLVVTREFVGYGGTDITGDVEKLLGITEKPTPSP
jgi:Skp family chaperone for outer membrane proteins